MKKLYVLLMMLLPFAGMAQVKSPYRYLESAVTVSLRAPVSAEGKHQLLIHLQTDEVYECSSFTMPFDVLQSKNNLTVRVLGVKDTPCEKGTKPAVADVDVSNLAPGTYEFKFYINRDLFRAQLIVEEKMANFTVIDENPDVFRIFNPEVHWFTEPAVWGKVSYTDAAMEAKVRTFLAEMEKAGCMGIQLPAGAYTDFFVHEDNVLSPKALGSGKFEFPFAYSYTGDFARLTQVVDQFAKQYPGLKFELKSTGGQVKTAG